MKKKVWLLADLGWDVCLRPCDQRVERSAALLRGQPFVRGGSRAPENSGMYSLRWRPV